MKVYLTQVWVYQTQKNTPPPIYWPLSPYLPCLDFCVFLPHLNQFFWNLSLHPVPQGLTFSSSHALPHFHPASWRCPTDMASLVPILLRLLRYTSGRHILYFQKLAFTKKYAHLRHSKGHNPRAEELLGILRQSREREVKMLWAVCSVVQLSLSPVLPCELSNCCASRNCSQRTGLMYYSRSSGIRVPSD